MVVVSSRLLDTLTLRNKSVSAMALWPFIIFRRESDRNNSVMMNHEKIHHRQQLEMLILPYYIWYFTEYWWSMASNGFKHHDAYMSVSFEKEAYANESNFNYLKSRKFLAAFKYLRKQNK